MDLRYTNIIPVNSVDNDDEDYSNNGIDISYDRKKKDIEYHRFYSENV